jgi:SAM-dependent methyltransferase
MQAPRDRPSVLLLQKDMSRSWHTHNEIESASLRSLYDIAWGKTHKDALQRSPAREFHNTMNTPMDVVSCQFAIHYFFRTEESLDTFCANVSSVLRPGGYFIGTHMDGARVHARLQSASNGQVEGRLNDNLLWRIARRYEPSTPLDELSKPGQRISVYLESINRASDEFLVFRETLVEALEKHGLRPAESEFDLPASGLFRDIYDPQLFTVHETLKEFSFLNRWFVFKKVA